MWICPSVLVLLTLLLCCHIPLAASVVVPADFTARLDGFLRCIMSDRSPLPPYIRTPELSIAVVANQQVLFTAGYGNSSSGAPITADTLFAIGSVSKAFTSTAAGMLADQGRLSLSERISRRVPLSTYDSYIDREASLRDLFTHHTGISRNDVIAAFHSTDTDWRAMLRQYVPLLQPSLPFRYQFFYNNWMIAQAALVIEAIIDVPWEDFITNMLLRPLGMANTTTTYQQSLSHNRATPYTNGPRPAAPPRQLPTEVDGWVDRVAPAGAIHSTANDMSKWLLFHLGSHPLLINQSTLDFLHSAQVTIIPPTTPFDLRGYVTATHPNLSVLTVGYGYNWEERVWNGHAAITHGGNTFGFISDLWFFPMDGFGYWVGLPAVSVDNLNLVALWIVAEMLGEVNMVDGVCQGERSAAENNKRWGEVKATLDPLLEEWNERRRQHSIVPTHSTDTAATTFPSAEPAGEIASVALEPSHLVGTYKDLVGPFGVINVSLNGDNNATFPLLLTWEATHMLLAPAGRSNPNIYDGTCIAPPLAEIVFPRWPGAVLFDVDADGTARGLRFYLGSPVPYLTAAAHAPNNFSFSSSSSSSTAGGNSGGSTAAVERDKTIELVVVLCIVSIVLLVAVSYALLITKRYRELKAAGGGDSSSGFGAARSSDGSLRDSLL